MNIKLYIIYFCHMSNLLRIHSRQILWFGALLVADYTGCTVCVLQFTEQT